MKNRLACLLASFVALLAAAPVSSAPPGGWSARVRATYLDLANQSDAFSALGINFGADAVKLNSKWIPEFDFTYTFTENLRAELVLTIPQKQDVTLAGVGKLGTFRHLPPTLVAQYHFSPGAAVQPYVGLGANFTLIYDANLKVANVPLDLESSSLGAAAQAGVDCNLGHGLYLNFDVKKAMLRSDVSVAGGARLTTAKLDPWLFSIGLGRRF